MTSQPMFSQRIDIVEVGPRDGLQSESQVLPTATKVEFVKRLRQSGLERIEVASFVNPKRVPGMADAAAASRLRLDARMRRAPPWGIASRALTQRLRRT